MIAAIAYIIIFTLVIILLPAFRSYFINPIYFGLAFLLKILFGFLIVVIYTKVYPDRSTADIFKYYDDAKVIYEAFENSPGDYIKMVSGIGNDSPHFDSLYYSKMNHWYRHYDFGTYNDNHTIIRFNAIAMLITGGSYYGNLVIMNFISFIGLWFIFATLVPYFPKKSSLIFAAVFLIPSVLFWGSGILKESLVLFTTGLFLYVFIRLVVHKTQKILNLIILIICTGLFYLNKSYLLFFLLPCLISFAINERKKITRPALTYLLTFTVSISVTILFSPLVNNKSFMEIFSQKQRDFINISKGGVFIQNNQYFVRLDPDKKQYLDTLGNNLYKIKTGSSYMYWKNENLDDTLRTNYSTDTMTYQLVWDLPLAGSRIEIPRLQPSFSSLILNSPMALFTGLFKPSAFSAHSLLERIGGIENLFLLIIIGLSLYWSGNTLHKNWLWFCIFLCLGLFTLIGFTTPIAGAIVRYKVPALPFLLMIAVNIFNERKLPKFMRSNNFR